MTEYTQTTFGSRGNCWQTAVACLLDVEPATLPDQSICDPPLPDGGHGTPFFSNWLGSYLRKHHDLAYFEIHVPEARHMLTVREPGWHFLTGETERTGKPDGSPRHVVVARYGEMVWDPHPSRAGLTRKINLALLVPFPDAWKSHRYDDCFCPSCIAERSEHGRGP